MAIRIIIDSASDIKPEEAKQLNLIHVPLKVTFNDVEYKDAVDLTHEQFYEKLIESDALPLTSQVNPADFSNVLDEVVKNNDIALIITLSSGLSGTYQSACIAADDYPGKVFVVDSENVSLGQRLLVERAIELVNNGVNIENIVRILDHEKKAIRLIAVLDTLEYLKKGGRISAAAAFAGEMLSIKPVISVIDGIISLIGKARGSKNANNFLRKCVENSNGIDFDMPFCVAYSGLSDHLLVKYIEDSADIWQGKTDRVPKHSVGAVIGTHAGPNAIGVAFFEKGQL